MAARCAIWADFGVLVCGNYSRTASDRGFRAATQGNVLVRGPNVMILGVNAWWCWMVCCESYVNTCNARHGGGAFSSFAQRPTRPQTLSRIIGLHHRLITFVEKARPALSLTARRHLPSSCPLMHSLGALSYPSYRSRDLSTLALLCEFSAVIAWWHIVTFRGGGRLRRHMAVVHRDGA